MIDEAIVLQVRSKGHGFELDPFLSEVARWIDREIIAEREEFTPTIWPRERLKFASNCTKTA
jgi:hypothetical protein